jgi:hypothetical protein
VLYLGRPRASVTIEAYRHLVDPFAAEGMTAEMVAPRRLVLCEVAVTNILDLRDPSTLAPLGLTEAHLRSPIGEYDQCWSVARVAHQLELHGILAPAATAFGETLALFDHHLPPTEMPILVGEETWERLPADPRQLRVIGGESSA